MDNATDKLALLPCPFCGSPARMRLAHGEYFASCTRTGVCYGYHDAYRKDRNGHFVHGFIHLKDAADLWNKREKTEPNAEDEKRNCEICGAPVMYGTRHHQC